MKGPNPSTLHPVRLIILCGLGMMICLLLGVTGNPVQGQGASGVSGRTIILNPGHGVYNTGDAWRFAREKYKLVDGNIQRTDEYVVTCDDLAADDLREDCVTSELALLLQNELIAAGATAPATRELDKNPIYPITLWGFPDPIPWWMMDSSEYLRTSVKTTATIGPDPGVPIYDVVADNISGSMNDDMRARPLYANSLVPPGDVGHSVMVSIHNNTDGSQPGIEIYYSSAADYRSYDSDYEFPTMEDWSRKSENIGACIKQELGEHFPDYRIDLRQGAYAENAIFHGPAVLIELGFLDNSDDFQRLSSDSFRSTATENIKNGLADYFNSGEAECPASTPTPTVTPTSTPTQTPAPEWPYNTSITINNTGDEQTGYPVRLEIGYLPGMNINFSDVRFAATQDGPFLDYWIEKYTPSGKAQIWVKVPSLPKGVTVLYLYYGSPKAMDMSNGSAVFSVFDDFNNGNSLNPDIWTGWDDSTRYGHITQGGGMLSFSYTGSELNDWWNGGIGRQENVLKLNPDLLATLPGNWEASVKLLHYATSDNQPPDQSQAGMALYDNDTSGYLFGLTRRNSYYKYEVIKIGSPSAESLEIHQVPAYLAIRHIDNAFSFYISFDGDVWYRVGNGGYSDPSFSTLALFGKEWGSNNLAFTMSGFKIRKIAPSEPFVVYSGSNNTRLLTVHNPGSVPLTNYPVRFEINYIPGMNSDFSDVRFQAESGGSFLNYWIETYTSSQRARIWVTVPSLPKETTTQLILSYGNTDSKTGNGRDVFNQLFDDFSDSSRSQTVWKSWQENKNGQISITAHGELSFSYSGAQNNDWWNGSVGRQERVLRWTQTMPAGDWEACVRLLSYTPGNDGKFPNQSTAGLALYDNDTSAFLFGLTHWNTYYKYELIKLGDSAAGTYPDTTVPAYLAIRRIGNLFSFYISFDGDAWNRVGSGGYADPSFSTLALFGKEWGTSNLAFTMDDFRIRKIALPEPFTSAP